MSTKQIEKLQIELASALNDTGLCTVHTVGSQKGDIRLLFTVRDTKEKQAWFRFLTELLPELQEHEEFYHFIGTKVMMDGGRMVQAWVFILSTIPGGEEDLATVVSDVRRIFRSTSEEMKNDSKQPFNVALPPPWAATANRVKKNVTAVK